MKTAYVVSVAALVLAGAPAAHALDVTKPEPCNGAAQMVDKPDDTHHDHMEIERAFFRWAGGELTANIHVKSLGLQVDHAQYSQSFWRFVYEAGATRYYVGATYTRDAAEPEYEYGTLSGTTFNRLGPTTGKFFVGTDGVVQLAVPREAQGIAGAALERSFVATAEGNTVLDAAERDWFDRAPGGTDWTDPEETTLGDPFVVDDCGAGVILTTKSTTVGFGRALRIRGRVLPAAAGVGVEIVHKESGRVAATATTKADGAFAVGVRPSAAGTYFARADRHKSGDVLVSVRPRVTLRLHRRAHGAVRFTGTVGPDRTGTVDLEKRAGDQWIVVGTATLRAGRFAKTVRAPGPGRFRASFASAAEGAVKGTSAIRSVP